MNKHNTAFSAMGLLLLLSLIVISHQSYDSLISLQDTLGKEIVTTEIAGVSQVQFTKRVTVAGSKILDEALARFGEDLQDATAIDAKVAAYAGTSLSTTLLEANRSLTPTLSDAEFVRAQALPTIVSILQAQGLAEVGRAFFADVREGFAQDMTASAALFRHIAPAAAAEAPSAGSGTNLVSMAQSLIDGTLASFQKSVEYCLNQITYLLPDYVDQAGVLVQTGVVQAQMLWNSRSALFHAGEKANAGAALFSGPVTVSFGEADSSSMGKWIGDVSLSLEKEILHMSSSEWFPSLPKADWLSN